jgi:peptide chain release factor 1
MLYTDVQHVNKTESAIRLTHVPTGISVSMQDSRSQHQNKAWAWEILRARLAAKRDEEEVAAKREARQQEVSTADRSERIRSYQLNQDRVTDHRIGITIGNVDGVLDGGIDVLIAALDEDFSSRRIKSILGGDGDLS